MIGIGHAITAGTVGCLGYSFMYRNIIPWATIVATEYMVLVGDVTGNNIKNNPSNDRFKARIRIHHFIEIFSDLICFKSKHIRHDGEQIFYYSQFFGAYRTK